ncbi:chemotaxis protein CheW [Stutzerimonas kirkiae]|uniref:Chemotaxis protein CheW n=1 Tax=Stutzerimonas kirkiae TaxID=2211392 RepID=A0A4Q9R4E2_9GAMM|nr:chemotaxis protein CheW [Stutzerimonas kirkiae]TBU94792.1 chemotaxis protein CheW [Stutzerimonas kirkiae]TBV01880.1 chemotaxis protein CheW [Stutzerimonas kirkiae]TBV07177.1 chemotaxis protein CheW [Stutzerimonas kirkiae]TBV11243.1 chemotaxis protein CheW [Stutzerimonas kirkiae]
MAAASLLDKPAAGGLYLLFRLGEDRYALDVHEVVEVLPLRRLKQVPEAPEWVAGVFQHRGRMVPVLDMSRRVLKRPAHVRNSTRLVLVRFDARQGDASPVLGLVLEQATDTLRLPSAAFRPSGLEAGQPGYLGPVQQDVEGLVQRIEVASLLDDALRALLFQPVEQG